MSRYHKISHTSNVDENLFGNGKGGASGRSGGSGRNSGRMTREIVTASQVHANVSILSKEELELIKVRNRLIHF